MPELATIQLTAPIRSVALVQAAEPAAGSDGEASNADQVEQLRAELDIVRAQVGQAVRRLDQALAQVAAFQEEQVQSCGEQIVRLAIGIAERIVLKQIEAGQYDIAKIVGETLKHAPAGAKAVLRLHPEDLETLQELMRSGGPGDAAPGLEHVELTADGQLGRGECVVDTDSVCLERRVDEQLRQIEQALKQGDGA